MGAPDTSMLYGDAWDLALGLAPASLDCIVTSPPYWGLRDYGHPDQFGLEATPQEYVAKLVDLFARLRPALKDEGTVWLNLGDNYANANPGSGGVCVLRGAGRAMTEGRYHVAKRDVSSLKPKDLVGIPWRVAFALREDGWWLRSDIIWAKPNPMPESVTDRPTKAHEYLFMLAKSERYFFDQDAVREDQIKGAAGSRFDTGKTLAAHAFSVGDREDNPAGRNIRTVWSLATKPYSGAHFAVFPPEIPERCIKAGCPEGGWVLDPFAGSGTTLEVARKLGRNAIGFELNEEYRALIDDRLKQGVLL
jgi:DNA modification methylase